MLRSQSGSSPGMLVGMQHLHTRHNSPNCLDMQCHRWQPFLCLCMLPAVQCHLQLLYLLVLALFEVLLPRVLPAGEVEPL